MRQVTPAFRIRRPKLVSLSRDPIPASHDNPQPSDRFPLVNALLSGVLSHQKTMGARYPVRPPRYFAGRRFWVIGIATPSHDSTTTPRWRNWTCIRLSGSLEESLCSARPFQDREAPAGRAKKNNRAARPPRLNQSQPSGGSLRINSSQMPVQEVTSGRMPIPEPNSGPTPIPDSIPRRTPSGIHRQN